MPNQILDKLLLPRKKRSRCLSTLVRRAGVFYFVICSILQSKFDPARSESMILTIHSREEGDSWVKELEDDVRHECEEKYGHVVHISLDPNTQGDIYLKFDKVSGGENAIKGLNGRFFGGRQISAQPVVDAVYSSLFSRTKAL